MGKYRVVSNKQNMVRYKGGGIVTMQEEPPISYQAIAQQRQAYFIYGLAILSLLGLAAFFFIDLSLNRYNEAYIISGLMVFYGVAIALVRSGQLRLATILVAIVGTAGFFVRAYTDKT